jgi:arylsulfatase A-like enzyme
MRSLLCLLLTLTAIAADRPNIIVILADDYGYGSAGCYGADPKLIRTPAIDRLAAEGRRFTDGNTTSSVCSPTRYSLLTGRYCWRTTLKHEVLGTFSPLHIEPTRVNLASLLKQKGYRTASVGKWHLGYGKENEDPKWRTEYKAELSPGPLDIGFDYHFGVPSNHGDLTGVYVENRFVYGLRAGQIPAGMKLAGPAADSDDYQATYGQEDTENGRAKILEIDAPRRKKERVMKVLTDKATDWLEAQPKDQPFFLYFAPVAVHNPITPDKDLAGKSAAGPYGDWIHELDQSVGRILATLDKMGATKDTLVLFTSDNGGVFRPENERLLQTTAIKAGLKINGTLRGSKHDVWEGGFKVPFIARWPGKVAAGSTATQMVSVVDILATTAEIVGTSLPAKDVGAEDSRSFLPVLLGSADAKGREDMIVHSADGVFAVRKGRWKWIEGVPVEEIKDGVRKTRKDQFRSQLYDTVADPAETKDVSAEHPEVVAELRDLLRRYRDGGFSRELPAADVKPLRVGVATLPALTGALSLDEPLAKLPGKPWVASAGEWSARDGGVFAKPKGGSEKAAGLRTPLAFRDGTFDCELNLQGANRISLRFGSGEGGFRLVVSRTSAILTKNPSKGEAATATEDIAKKNLKLAAGEWVPVRLTFTGDEVTVQVNDQTFKGKHPSLAKDKTSLDFLVFGDGAGFRNVRVAK